MQDDSNPMRLFEPDGALLRWQLNGCELEAHSGDTVAAALLAADIAAFRQTTVSGTARGPFCLMGACYDCLVEIDGEPNRQACMVQVADGMVVHSMQGARVLPGGKAPGEE